MNQKWSEKTILQKVMEIISGIAFLVYIVFLILEMTGKVKSTDLITCIVIGVICICEAISFWNTKRTVSYIAIAGLVILTVVVVLINTL